MDVRVGLKESWALKNWCLWNAVLEKTLESPLNCKEILPVHAKGNQSWIFIGRTGVEAETPILWPPDAKSWLIWKYPDAGQDWGQEEKGMTEDEIDGWMASLTQWTWVGDGRESLACCSPWGRKELDVTEWLNWTGMPFSPQSTGKVLFILSGSQTWAHPQRRLFSGLSSPLTVSSRGTGSVSTLLYPSLYITWHIVGFSTWWWDSKCFSSFFYNFHESVLYWERLNRYFSTFTAHHHSLQSF